MENQKSLFTPYHRREPESQPERVRDVNPRFKSPLGAPKIEFISLLFLL
jgi:hypothetical protein